MFCTEWPITSYCLTARYRSTAALIVYVLMCGHQSPNRALNEYVAEFTKFTPTDYQQDAENELPIPKLAHWGVTPLNFDKMSASSTLTYLHTPPDKCFGPQTNNRRRH